MCVFSDDRRRSRSPRRRSQSRSDSRSPRRRRRSSSRDRHSRHHSHSPSPSSSSSLERTLRIRGLPFGATTDDVTEFFRPLRLSSSSPVLCVPLDQRPPGEAYVRFKSREDAERGMRRHRAMMQRRFIEVFHVVDQKELDEARAVWCTLEEASDRLNIDTTWEQDWKEEDGYVVRLRGLPWESSITDLRQFFSPLQMDESDVDIVIDGSGRPSGEAYVRLRDRDGMQMALNRNRKTMGKRYIEVYKSTLAEFNNPDQRKELERKPIPAAAGPQGGLRDVRDSRLHSLPALIQPLEVEEAMVAAVLHQPRVEAYRVDWLGQSRAHATASCRSTGETEGMAVAGRVHVAYRTLSAFAVCRSVRPSRTCTTSSAICTSPHCTS